MDSPSNTKQFVENQLSKSTDESKKWRMVMFGARGVALIFIVSNVFIMLRPDLASVWASNMQITMYSFSGIVSLFLGAQGAVDFRNSATLSTIDTNEVKKMEIKKTEDIHHVIEYTEKSDRPRDFRDFEPESFIEND